MLLVVHLTVVCLFIVLGIVFASGRGAGLIAGYNTEPEWKKAKTDEKKLCKAMSVMMFALAVCWIVAALGEIFKTRVLLWIGMALFAAVIIAGLIYMNTGDRFRK